VEPGEGFDGWLGVIVYAPGVVIVWALAALPVLLDDDDADADAAADAAADADDYADADACLW